MTASSRSTGTAPAAQAKAWLPGYGSAGLTDVLAQLAFAELIESGALDRHVRRMRRRYHHRRDALLATLGRYAPAMPVHGVAAGLHAVVSVPDGIAEDDVIAAARERHIALTGLAPCWHQRPRSEGLVLGYGSPPEYGYPTALEHLGHLLAAFAG